MRGITVCLLLFLSGCFGGGSSGSEGSPAEPVVPEVLGDSATAPPPINVTGTLHLLGAPDVSLLAPAGDESIETPLPFGLALEGLGDGSQDWEYVATSEGTLHEVSARIWIRVTQPLVTDGEGPLCAVVVNVVVYGIDDTNGVGRSEALCGRLQSVVEPGDYELDLGQAPFEDPVAFTPGMTFVIEVRRYGAGAGVGDPVLLLSGSAEHDSHVWLRGMQEPEPVSSRRTSAPHPAGGK